MSKEVLAGETLKIVMEYITSRDALRWIVGNISALSTFKPDILEALRGYDINTTSRPSRRLIRQVRDAPDDTEVHNLLVPFTRGLSDLTGKGGLVETYTMALVTSCKPATVTTLLECMLRENLLKAIEVEGDTFFRLNPPRLPDLIK